MERGFFRGSHGAKLGLTQMATYLVTGAAGFIAARVCEMLLAGGHAVVGIDNLNDYYDVTLKDYRLGRILRDDRWRQNRGARQSVFVTGGPYRRERFDFRWIDVEDLAALEKLFAEVHFDAIFNLAARAGVRASMANPYIFLSTNTEGTLNILECQRRFGVKKQVLASTSSLYAGCAMPFSEDLPVNEPRSPYAAAKKAAELMAHCYHKLYDLDITILRYFTVFGPAGRPDMAPFRFIKWIEEGTPITLYGDGTQARDFTYVDDIATGTIKAVKPLGYEIINLGGGRNPLTLNALIAFIEATVGRKATIDRRPFHIADVNETWADIRKAERLLDWHPLTTAEEGFARTIEWHLAEQPWLQSVKV